MTAAVVSKQPLEQIVSQELNNIFSRSSLKADPTNAAIIEIAKKAFSGSEAPKKNVTIDHEAKESKTSVTFTPDGKIVDFNRKGPDLHYTYHNEIDPETKQSVLSWQVFSSDKETSSEMVENKKMIEDIRTIFHRMSNPWINPFFPCVRLTPFLY